MKPRDYAKEIEPGASAARVHEIERIIRRAMADELCRVASVIDDQDRKGKIRFPPDAAQICRTEANAHLYHA